MHGGKSAQGTHEDLLLLALVLGTLLELALPLDLLQLLVHLGVDAAKVVAAVGVEAVGRVDDGLGPRMAAHAGTVVQHVADAAAETIVILLL